MENKEEIIGIIFGFENVETLFVESKYFKQLNISSKDSNLYRYFSSPTVFRDIVIDEYMILKGCEFEIDSKEYLTDRGLPLDRNIPYQTYCYAYDLDGEQNIWRLTRHNDITSVCIVRTKGLVLDPKVKKQTTEYLNLAEYLEDSYSQENLYVWYASEEDEYYLDSGNNKNQKTVTEKGNIKVTISGK